VGRFIKNLPGFKTVVLSQFKAHLKDHWMAATKDSHQALQEEQYLKNNQWCYPRLQPYNERGGPKFGMHPTKLLLWQDSQNKVHLTTYKYQESFRLQGWSTCCSSQIHLRNALPRNQTAKNTFTTLSSDMKLSGATRKWTQCKM
jgi:hypothetical protein